MQALHPMLTEHGPCRRLLQPSAHTLLSRVAVVQKALLFRLRVQER